MTYKFNLSEREAADLLNRHVRTLRNWRKNDTLPSYIYRSFGRAGHPTIRYCGELLERWQAIHPDDVSELQKEEMAARKELAKALAGERK